MSERNPEIEFERPEPKTGWQRVGQLCIQAAAVIMIASAPGITLMQR